MRVLSARRNIYILHTIRLIFNSVTLCIRGEFKIDLGTAVSSPAEKSL